MSAEAILMMIVTIAIIWGGLVASVVAFRTFKLPGEAPITDHDAEIERESGGNA